MEYSTRTFVSQGSNGIGKKVRGYDAKLDTKKRFTLRNVLLECYHISELEDGTIILKPRKLRTPIRVSANTLDMTDKSIKRKKKESIKSQELSELED